MRRTRNLIIFITLTLGILLYFFQHTPVAITHTQPLDPGSLQISNIKAKSTINYKEKKPSVKVEPSQFDSYDQNNKNNKENIDLDYITAYRDWQYFENCYTDIEDFGNDKDPLDTLKERFDGSWRESQSEPTSQQNMYYQHHVDICKTLINDVGGDDDDYNQIIYNLYHRFELLTPKTAEEKQLDQALKLREQLDSLKIAYSSAHYPRSSLSLEEQTTLSKKIQQLTLSMMEIYDGNNELSPEQTQIIVDYSNEIESLQNLLTPNLAVDPERIKLAEQNINTHLNTMDMFLLKVKSPDAFLITAGELFKPEYLQKDSDIMKQVKAQTHIYDNYYLGILNNLVHPLVACSMDYPCDAESDLILSYCLGLKDSMFNQACGLSLEDFYFTFYIGANQLDDVNRYFNYLVNRYAN